MFPRLQFAVLIHQSIGSRKVEKLRADGNKSGEASSA